MNSPHAVGMSANRSIGAILIDAGRLSPADAEQVLRLQREKGLRFGEAALQLGLLTEQDIAFGLARQFDYPYVIQGSSKISTSVVAAYDPQSPAVESLRALRSQLMLRWFKADVDRKTLAVTSPGKGEGRSWLTANLGVVFSQLGERTLIVDADLRTPAQHVLFGVDNRVGLSTLLSGRCGAEVIQRIPGLLDLSILPAGSLPPNPLELLSRPSFSSVIDALSAQYDIVLFDTPATSDFADSQTVAARAGGALLLTHKDRTRMRQLTQAHETLLGAGVVIVGGVVSER